MIRRVSEYESDLVGDHYAFIRTSGTIVKLIKYLIDERNFLEAIGIVYMRLADDIETCSERFSKCSSIKTPKLVGAQLKLLWENGIIDFGLYRITQRFISIRNDVVHRRWDGSIKKFRKECYFGIQAGNAFGDLMYDFLDFDTKNSPNDPLREFEVVSDVFMTEDGKIETVDHKPNIELFKKLELLQEFRDYTMKKAKERDSLSRS